MTLGFGVGAAVTGALAQWAPGPTLTPFVLTVSLLVLTIIPTVFAPETVGATAPQQPPQDSWVSQLRTPSATHPNFIIKVATAAPWVLDRKSTRLNSSHVSTSYAVFCLI